MDDEAVDLFLRCDTGRVVLLATAWPRQRGTGNAIIDAVHFAIYTVYLEFV